MDFPVDKIEKAQVADIGEPTSLQMPISEDGGLLADVVPDENACNPLVELSRTQFKNGCHSGCKNSS